MCPRHVTASLRCITSPCSCLLQPKPLPAFFVTLYTSTSPKQILIKTKERKQSPTTQLWHPAEKWTPTADPRSRLSTAGHPQTWTASLAILNSNPKPRPHLTHQAQETDVTPLRPSSVLMSMVLRRDWTMIAPTVVEEGTIGHRTTVWTGLRVIWARGEKMKRLGDRSGTSTQILTTRDRGTLLRSYQTMGEFGFRS